ncbi:unnamed protein product [Brassica oleracea]|uniref:Uncharacterized protein n=2 Tax=Brassica TaxID=3705 RepID=A0A0D3BYJ9_BRAOL|nr:unnamed protein product [Brassica napus]
MASTLFLPLKLPSFISNFLKPKSLASVSDSDGPKPTGVVSSSYKESQNSSVSFPYNPAKNMEPLKFEAEGCSRRTSNSFVLWQREFPLSVYNLNILLEGLCKNLEYGKTVILLREKNWNWSIAINKKVKASFAAEVKVCLANTVSHWKDQPHKGSMVLAHLELWILDPPAHSADEEAEVGRRSSSDYFSDDLNH